MQIFCIGRFCSGLRSCQRGRGGLQPQPTGRCGAEGGRTRAPEPCAGCVQVQPDVPARRTADKTWDEWGSEDFAAIDRCGCRQASCEKLHFDEHRAFGSAYFLELGLSCQQLEQNIPALFTDPACGHVLRAKGFVQDENGWVELNATADGLTANAIPKGQEVLIVIGEGLEKERIEVRLKG